MTIQHTRGVCCEQLTKQEEIYGAYKIFFRTLVSEPRLKILKELQKGTKNVTELTTALNTEQTLVSHDLTRLKKCGFVTVEKKGKYRYYSINKKTIEPLLAIIEEHMSQHCVHILREQKKPEGNT